MEKSCKKCINVKEEGSGYQCTLQEVQEYKKGDPLSTGQYKIVDENYSCNDFEPKDKQKQ